jgi:hypothetical protein
MVGNALMTPVELTGAELDAVSAGQNTQNGVGLIVANLGNTLNGFTINALNGNTVTITDIANNNTITVPIGIAVAAVGGAAGVLNKFA